MTQESSTQQTPQSLSDLLDVELQPSIKEPQPSTETLQPSATPAQQTSHRFLGLKPRDSRGRVFGGQVIGQALVAAHKTVDTPKVIHSLHAYFMRAGDNSQLIDYEVIHDRDGRNFSTRRVQAEQNGKPILNLIASFHTPESGLNHQQSMPDAPPPEGLLNNHQLAAQLADQLPENILKLLTRRRPIEIRPTNQALPFSKQEPSTQHSVWFRARHPIGDNPIMHLATLAFASDMGLLSTCMRPHGINWHTPNLMSASLDHSLWFHEPVISADEWMLYVMDTPWAGGARGFNRGSIYARDGRLIASATQEGLMRLTDTDTGTTVDR